MFPQGIKVVLGVIGAGWASGSAENKAQDCFVEPCRIIGHHGMPSARNNRQLRLVAEDLDHPIRDVRRNDVRGGSANDQARARDLLQCIPERLGRGLFSFCPVFRGFESPDCPSKRWIHLENPASVFALFETVFRHAPDDRGWSSGVVVQQHLLVFRDIPETGISVLSDIHLYARGAPSVQFWGGVNDHESRHFFGMSARVEHADSPTERMSDEHGALDREIFEHGVEVCHEVWVLVFAVQGPARISVAALIEAEDPVVTRDLLREILPDVCFVAEAMHQDHRNAFLTPLQQVKIEAL
jgi:hypothetical protein